MNKLIKICILGIWWLALFGFMNSITPRIYSTPEFYLMANGATTTVVWVFSILVTVGLKMVVD